MLSSRQLTLKSYNIAIYLHLWTFLSDPNSVGCSYNHFTIEDAFEHNNKKENAEENLAHLVRNRHKQFTFICKTVTQTWTHMYELMEHCQVWLPSYHLCLVPQIFLMVWIKPTITLLPRTHINKWFNTFLTS